MRKLRDTKLGGWLKTTAPDILRTLGDIVPDAGALDIIALILEGRLKNKLERRTLRALIDELTVSLSAEVSTRWRSDLTSDSRLAKNVRPIVLLSCLGFLFIVILLDAFDALNFTLSDSWLNLLEVLVFTVFGAYFAGRTVEKTVKKRR
jgi:hypothetical protein